MELGALEIIIGLAILLFSFYYYLTSNFKFWKNRHVRGPKPIPLFGNFKDVILGKIHAGLSAKNIYEKYKGEQVVGLFNGSRPCLLIRDPDLVKDVMIKDFNVFPERGIRIDSKTDRHTQNLFNLEAKRWRPLRSKLTPVFTSAKVKDMFYLILDCANNFDKLLDKLPLDEPIECKDLIGKYTIQSIGVCAFGLDTQALHENSEFSKFGREYFLVTFKNTLRRVLRELAPKLYRLVGPWLQNTANDYFAQSILNTGEYRKQNNVRRNDFFDLLMDLQKQPVTANNMEFTHTLLTSQALAFFVLGFETSSVTASNVLYEMALNQKVQDNLREEITNVLQGGEGVLSYDLIKSMKYLDKIIKETLRKYPPAVVLQRMSVTPYTFNGTKVTIPENTIIYIPTLGIHHDPELYPDPERFDPERYNEENERSRHPMHYLPFGNGQRNCIGMHFALCQIKIGIIKIINKFRVDVCDKTCIPYVIEPRQLLAMPVGGVHLKLTKL